MRMRMCMCLCLCLCLRPRVHDLAPAFLPPHRRFFDSSPLARTSILLRPSQFLPLCHLALGYTLAVTTVQFILAIPQLLAFVTDSASANVSQVCGWLLRSASFCSVPSARFFSSSFPPLFFYLLFLRLPPLPSHSAPSRRHTMYCTHFLLLCCLLCHAMMGRVLCTRSQFLGVGWTSLSPVWLLLIRLGPIFPIALYSRVMVARLRGAAALVIPTHHCNCNHGPPPRCVWLPCRGRPKCITRRVCFVVCFDQSCHRVDLLVFEYAEPAASDTESRELNDASLLLAAEYDYAELLARAVRESPATVGAVRNQVRSGGGGGCDPMMMVVVVWQWWWWNLYQLYYSVHLHLCIASPNAANAERYEYH
jgi:hypothetical protein